MAIEAIALENTLKQLDISSEKIKKVLDLLINQECTIPFIARYRKEQTGGLDEVQIQLIQKTFETNVETEKRREFVLSTIKEMEKLTPELEKKIKAAPTLSILEDLYAPYKSKKKTRAQLAIEAGLAPLAELIKSGPQTIEQIEADNGQRFLNKEAKINSFKDALDGAQHILIEEIAHNIDIKEKLRKDYWDIGNLKAVKKKDADSIKDAPKFKDYFEFEQKVSMLKDPKQSHRFLAVKRGMSLKVLKIDIAYPEEQALNTIKKIIEFNPSVGCREIVEKCISRAYNASIHSSLDLEIKSELKKLADEAAIDVFGVNLKNLLLQPYLGQKAVIGIDPGVRTGCKVAVIDKNGNFLADTVIYPHEPQNDTRGAKETLETCIEQLSIEYIAVGNGTFGRETLEFLKKNVKQVVSGKTKAMLVNEDGASIYSASDIARKEFPDKDLTVRGAISIARRFQDPLGELVKLDPKSIGVGQYQHDVNQSKLKRSLTGVVENCVNFVGVDLNTASAPLLSYISGIGPSVAENIVKQRQKSGGFKTRKELLNIGRFTQKVFEQSAGFLRIYDGENPLDSTFIHPEKYEVLENWANGKGLDLNQLTSDPNAIEQLKSDHSLKESLGVFTYDDIIKSLTAPSQDPRSEFQPFEYRNDLNEISGLKVNEWYPGIVTNITQFGAFVDLGIKENGLVHVSEIADKFVENPLSELKVGQEVKARVLDVDLGRKRVALSLKTGTSHSKSPSKGTRPQSNNKGQVRRNQQPQKQLKNNAFAALKNFKPSN